MYTLYYSPGAASMCVHQALIETGTEYTLELVDLQAGRQRDPAYLKLNPGGVVPTLIIDGQPYWESAALLMTVAERNPQAQLAPELDSPARAVWYQWIVHLANTVQPAFRLWFYPDDVPGDANVHAAIKAAVQKKIEGEWERIDVQLRERGPYLLGNRFSAADIFLLMLMRWSRNMPKPATQWPVLSEFARTVKARPSWKLLCEREGLIEWA